VIGTETVVCCGCKLFLIAYKMGILAAFDVRQLVDGLRMLVLVCVIRFAGKDWSFPGGVHPKASFGAVLIRGVAKN
jgi:hypothetical protein